MAAVLCIHCQVPPERRQQEGTGLVMWICPVCNNRGEVTPSEGRALASWNLVNDEDMPRHTCIDQGVPRFFISGGKWGSRATSSTMVMARSRVLGLAGRGLRDEGAGAEGHQLP
ncbi:hypothetical protein [Pseudomonas aeruginosa]|uniref:hypothetical protein n=1 Tax=Pseudomonas aeruginosa TaxID=287 RepID=UPI0037491537